MSAQIASRVFALRHVERDKANRTDPQTPTEGGEIAAYAMGMQLRKQFGITTFADCISSPQPRATRTAEIVMAGIAGYGRQFMPEIQVDPRLDDFSSDKRPEIEAGLAACKEFGKQWAIEPELAIFMVEVGISAAEIKIAEAMEILARLAIKPGDHLIAGLHGGTIDGLWMIMDERLTGIKPNFGKKGPMFDKVEGFMAEFDPNGQIVSLGQIRQPAYLKTLATVIK